jgi:L-fuculose-phosphate aldolase
MTSSQLRRQIILYSHRLDAKGFVANHDGNISARLNDRFLATPTARGKFDLTENDLIVIDASGKTRAGTGKVFSEWTSHSEIFRQREDVGAVVHAHPPHASSFGLSAQTLPVDFWPEGVVSLGRAIPCVTNVTELGQAARRASAALVQGNGVFAWGETIEQAYLRLELIEHLTQIYTLAKSAGTLKHLPSDAVGLLLDKRKKAGLFAPEELY